MTLPGSPVDATVWRTPRAGGQFIEVLSLTLRSFLGVLFQPERQFQFQQQQGAVQYKRLLTFADWPQGVADPQPIHPGDQLRVLFPMPVESLIVASPAPTTTAAYVTGGTGQSFTVGQQATIGSQNALLTAVSGDLLTYTQPNGQPLAAAPQGGDVVTQLGQSYVIDDADCYTGHHIEIYLRSVPRNA